MNYDEQVVPVFEKEKGLSVKTKELQKQDWEWKEVEKIFRRSMDVEIKALFQIENKWLHESYLLYKKKLVYKNSGVVNEKLLFHGTVHTDPKLHVIYCSEVGFDVTFSKKGRWGHAIYFSEKASFANKYAHITATGVRQLLLANVLTGFSYSSVPDDTLRLPSVRAKDFFRAAI